MTEQWKDIAGFEGIYQISSTGRIDVVSTCSVLNVFGLFGVNFFIFFF